MSDNEDIYGPTLPPHLKKRKHSESIEDQENIVGPCLPPKFVKCDDHDKERESNLPQKIIYGAQPPSHSLSSDSEEEIGPALPTNEDLLYRKSKSLTPEKEISTQRDDWMINPGESVLRIDPLKLKSRQFIRKSNAINTESNISLHSEKEKKLAKAVKVYNDQHRSKSLLSKHERKVQNRDKNQDQDDPSSRPFDREKDIIGTQRFDTKKTKEFINKAGELNDRFGHSRFM